jgi:RNA polymerase sigma-70 factor, ECF subfamily
VSEISSDTDLGLFKRLAARDESALADLYDRHSRLAYGVIVRILRSAADAEDVLQETFVRVWTRAETYDPRLGSPAAWLVRIARNRAIDRLRAMSVREGISVDSGSRVDDTAARQPAVATRQTPGATMHDRVMADTVRSAMEVLSATQRELIEAAFFEGYTHCELSRRFGLPLGTVKTRIRAGLSAMRGRLEQAV